MTYNSANTAWSLIAIASKKMVFFAFPTTDPGFGLNHLVQGIPVTHTRFKRIVLSPSLLVNGVSNSCTQNNLLSSSRILEE